MIADVRREGAKVGLELHPDKTKIQHNNIGYGSGVTVARVGDMDIEVLGPNANAMYLGRALSLTDAHGVELAHRLKKAWAKFGLYRQELTDKDIPLHLRLKLFHSVVTPTVLYGSGSWVMTCAREQTLRSTQMKMIKSILGRRRLVKQHDGEEGQSIETWVEWVQRVTGEARDAMKLYNIPDWVDEQRNRLHRWGDRLKEMSSERWARRAFDWVPDGRRSRGHPRTRWSDQLLATTH
jgi:hypothetical protein